MSELDIIEYLEIINFIKSKCTNEICSNKRIKTELDFYNKYPFIEEFNRRFKCKDFFEENEIDNKKYQQIIKLLCPKIDLVSINKKKKLRNFFEEMFIILVFVYLFSNELYIMYRYYNKLENKSLTEVYTTQRDTINKLSDEVDSLSVMNTNIEESINNRTLTSKITDLENEVVDQNNTYDSLNLFLASTISEYNNKLQQLDYIITSGDIYINNVPTINQYPSYPSGCESISLLILLKYAGVDVTAEQIVAKLRTSARPYYVSSNRYGNDPEIYFIGNPTDTNGFGVYEKPIISAALNFKSDIKNITGSNLNDILKVVMQGHPVQVWVAMDGVSAYYAYSWTDEITGKIIFYPAQFHSLVIIGFNQYQIITSDPSVGGIRYFNRYYFENSFNFFGKRAIYYE
jgi:uncharacterized protein YvpB